VCGARRLLATHWAVRLASGAVAALTGTAVTCRSKWDNFLPLGHGESGLGRGGKRAAACNACTGAGGAYVGPSSQCICCPAKGIARPPCMGSCSTQGERRKPPLLAPALPAHRCKARLVHQNAVGWGPLLQLGTAVRATHRLRALHHARAR